METFQFHLVSPDKLLLEQAVSMVVIPGLEGDIGVLPQHTPLVTLLRPGVVSVYENGKILVKIFVNGGFAEITPERCRLLVTEGTPLESLDRSALEIKVKNLIADIVDSQTPEERKKIDQNLEITQAKLMEVIVHQKMG